MKYNFTSAKAQLFKNMERNGFQAIALLFELIGTSVMWIVTMQAFASN